MNSWCEVLTMDFYKVAFLLGAFICTGLRADQPANSAEPQCEMSKADIVILLDHSEYISSEDFYQMKSFISDLVQNLPIGPNEVQIGLSEYGQFTGTAWDLNSHNNTQSLLKAIDRIEHRRDISYMGAALDHVLKHNFQSSAGMRPDSKKKVVLITGGKSVDKVFIPAQKLKHSGIEIYVIGADQDLYSSFAIDQLRTVAPEHFQSHFYLFSSFQSLFNAANNISSNLCHGATNQEQQGSQCKMSEADIVILLDGSQSISSKDFPKKKSFIYQIVQNLPIGPNEVQIGLTQYSENPETEWDLNSHNNKQSLLQAINAVEQMEGTVNTGKALDHVLNHNFQLSAGMRPDSIKKLILITYYLSTDSVEIPAKNLKDSGVDVYAIGMGRKFDRSNGLFQMQKIASSGYERRLYTFKSYRSLREGVISISNSFCATNMEKLGSQCEMSKTDIVILVDGSSANTDAVKSFISHLLQNLSIGPDEVQIGLTQFGRKAKTVWNLNSHNNTQSLLEVINATQQRSGQRRLAAALDHVLKHNFQPSAGMRPDSKKKLILITDGILDNIEIPAQNLKDNRIEIFVIVHGEYVDIMRAMYQLMAFASEDVKRHYYLFPTNQSLHNAAINISSSLCHGATNLEQGSRCEMSKADIVMLVGGISYKNFPAVKSFISQVVQNLPIGPNKVQIGLTQCDLNPETKWHLNHHKNKWSLLEAIDRIQEMSVGMFIGEALDHVLKHSFTPSAGMRPDSKKKLVLITDRISPDDIEIPAKNLKDSGIELYIIVVFEGANDVRFMCQLRTMASQDIKRHLYLFSSEQSVHDAVTNVSSSLCHGATNLEQLGLQADQTNLTDNITPLKGYSKTEGAMVLSEFRNRYTVKSVTDCAAKCDSETSFTCKSFAYLEQNQGCWTWAANSKTGPVVQNWNSVLYEKNKYLLECVNEKGADYRGTVNRTKSGKLCQRWDAMSPHKAMFTPQDHPLADLESNFCRNPSGIIRSPWCYTTDPETVWELCDIPSCTEECMHCRGEDYKGKISVTENGFTCQRWDSQIPHNHGFIPTVFPEKFLEENYCRNPNRDSRPWCYTSSPSRRWDYCSIPRCTSDPPSIIPELSCITGNGESYRGAIAVTTSGKKCQRWASQTPHRHNYTPESYPCSGLDYNFCRNPGKDQRPWCYTTDPETRWEYCNVPCCADASNSPVPEATFNETRLKGYSKTEGAMVVSVKGRKFTVKTVTECAAKCNNETSFLCKSFAYVEKDHECWTTASNSKTGTVVHRVNSVLYEKNDFLLECVKESGTHYRGTEAKTKSGKLCQRWEADTPHNVTFKPENYPLADLDSNFCRNPDLKSQGPWCYTTDPDTVWEHCDVLSCTEDCMQPGADVYKGKTSITENGFICQRWASLEPHSHGYTPKVFPNKFLEENYCRNPSGDSRPWCYTTSPSKRWDYCTIPLCKPDSELTCITGRGEAYRGTVGVTASGKTCQEWSALTPHYHPSIVPERFPDAGLDKNYCRNPDNERKPWCFTTDPSTLWEYCSLPRCNNSINLGECMHCNGEDYRGSVSWTEQGFTCQRWDSQTPHQHSAHQVYGGETLDENYCRNPSKDPLPWCYTTDPAKRWDYCSIPRCSSAPPAIIPELNCITGDGKNYRGTISVTRNGNRCKRWSETPHTPEKYPCSGLDNNYCRNVLGKESQPWCYINSNKWELCNVRRCFPYTYQGFSYDD